LERQPGDVYDFAGGVLKQYRAGNLIAERTLGAGLPFIPGPETGTGLLETVYFFQETKMPGIAETLTDVVQSQPSGIITAKFSGGENIEYPTFADLKTAVEALDTDGDVARKLLLLKLVRSSPDGSNLDALNGSTCTIDGNAATPVQFSLTV